MKIGIIGAGNMANAIIKGLVRTVPPENIFVSDKDGEKLNELAKTGIKTGDNPGAASFGDIIILAVKPNIYETVLNEIKNVVAGKTVISIAAGISIGFVKSILGDGQKVVRTMPNTPALVGEGMTSISYEPPVDNVTLKDVTDIFSSFGKTIVIPENLMDAAVSVGGSSPAYAFMMIDAMAKKAEKMGMDYQSAVTAAAQSMLGAAKMVLETGESPESLKIKVCSPGGTTLEAVRVFDENDLFGIVSMAMEACANKSREMKR